METRQNIRTILEKDLGGKGRFARNSSYTAWHLSKKAHHVETSCNFFGNGEQWPEFPETSCDESGAFSLIPKSKDKAWNGDWRTPTKAKKVNLQKSKMKTFCDSESTIHRVSPSMASAARVSLSIYWSTSVIWNWQHLVIGIFCTIIPPCIQPSSWSYFGKKKVTVLEHPLYSPDLASADFCSYSHPSEWSTLIIFKIFKNM